MGTSAHLRQGLRGLASSLLFGLVLWGCVPTALPATAPPEAEKPAAPQEKPTSPLPAVKKGGILHFAQRQNPDSLNPYKGASLAEQALLGPVYDTLLKYRYKPGEDYRIDYPIEGSLAERWEQPNETTYLFHLRRGISWQDGTLFTADDVVWTYTYVVDPQNAFPRVANLKAIKTVEAVDRYTVKITTEKPSPDLLIGIADRISWILPKHVADRGDSYDKVVIGTGPYKLASFERDKGAEWVRNEKYWEKDRPHMDGLKMFLGLDAAAMLAAFHTRELDIHTLPAKKEMDQLLMLMPDARYEKFITVYGNALLMKLDRKPFSDIRVRRALHLAVDRQAMLKVLTDNTGVINPPGSMPGMKTGWTLPGYLELPGYRADKIKDLEEAKRLLKEAGLETGFKTSVKLTSTSITSPSIAAMLATQFKEIGVELELWPMDRPEFNQALVDGDYETILELIADSAPWQRFQQYFHAKGVQNKMPIRDPRLDQLIDKAGVTLNQEEQKKLFIEMQKIIEENVYAIPTVDYASYAAWQPYVHDYMYNIGTQTYPYNTNAMWLDADRMPKR